MTPVLRLDNLSRSFGGVFAVRDVSLAVPSGETRGLIGPNGAGKSTLFNLVAGLLRPDAGRVALEGDEVTRLPAHRRAAQGVAIVFQGARVFPGLTAVENVMVGAHTSARHGFLGAAIRSRRCRREEREIREAALAALERVGLAEWADVPAESLPLGQQRRAQLARALCARPRLLLLDEPAAGLRGAERAALAGVIDGLRGEGLTMMLVEHDVGFVSRLADRVTVLDLGAVIAEGTPDEVRRDPAVVAAYLGAPADPAAGSAAPGSAAPGSAAGGPAAPGAAAGGRAAQAAGAAAADGAGADSAREGDRDAGSA
ncbi:ABC transporter ATP-binding protein [Cryptosporangium aurantiacum]|uniref:Amino acid/amide ABC transporter ATP-binding protein 1, HAAT family n=1 Tax=Cryptosporangium aurantiacum TaxID=134849 RepID=A0A1M7R701_9ACTN|nr:ABC transporter ATP-binding protein [Cryptosporangium aurantiacum]SHN41909.1 amino acid/amide ABC transporter ATP-binding protein 1, HAAT family [Cryptosporangium aurantiacum]